MTRGSLYYVSDNYIVETQEFNGDMYRDGHGENVMLFLTTVDNLKEFKKEVRKFNGENHNYDCELFYNCKRSDYIVDKGEVDEIDLATDYFSKFFSDWTFWKNKSSKTIVFLTRDEGGTKRIELKPDEQVAINFGYNEGHYKLVTELV